jgi:hypothetical protein
MPMKCVRDYSREPVVRDGPSHGHSTSRHTQDQRILALVRGQPSGQLLRGLLAILETYTS